MIPSIPQMSDFLSSLTPRHLLRNHKLILLASCTPIFPAFAEEDWGEFGEVRDFTPVLELSFANQTLPSALGLGPVYSKVMRCNVPTGEMQYYTDEDGRHDETNETFSRNPWTPMEDRLRIYAHPQTEADHAMIDGVQRYVDTRTLAGMFTTQNAFWFEQGAAEIEAALPIQPGSFPAIWFLQEEAEAPPEVDLVEIPGPKSGAFQLTYHENNADYNDQIMHKSSVSAHWPGLGHDTRRRFGLIIDRNADGTRYRYRYFYDRQLVYVVIPDDYHPILPKVASAPFYRNLLVNFAVNSKWMKNTVDETTDWDQMYMDVFSVKMWQKPIALPGTAIFDLDTGDAPEAVLSALTVRRSGEASVFRNGVETLVPENTPRIGVDLRTGRILGLMLERGTTNLLAKGTLDPQNSGTLRTSSAVVDGGWRFAAQSDDSEAVVRFTAPACGSYVFSTRMASNDPIREIAWQIDEGTKESALQRGLPREVPRWMALPEQTAHVGQTIELRLGAGNAASHGAHADWIELGAHAQVERADGNGARATSWTPSTRGEETLLITPPDSRVANWQVWGRGEWGQKMDLGEHTVTDGVITLSAADFPSGDLRPVALPTGNRHLRAVSVEPVE